MIITESDSLAIISSYGSGLGHISGYGHGHGSSIGSGAGDPHDGTGYGHGALPEEFQILDSK